MVSGKDTSGVDAQLADLAQFVSEYEAELDELLRKDDCGSDDDSMEVDGKKGKGKGDREEKLGVVTGDGEDDAGMDDGDDDSVEESGIEQGLLQLTKRGKGNKFVQQIGGFFSTA